MVTAKTSNLVLRIFSGAHVGAEINLSAARLVIGKQDTCDVVLMDNSLQPEHIAISVKDGNAFLEVLNDAPVLIDGVTVKENFILQDFQYIFIGSTLLSTGPADAVWPDISLTTMPKPSAEEEKPSTQEPAAENKPEETSSDIDLTPKPEAETAEAVTEEAPKPKSNKLRNIILIIALVIVGISLLSGVVYFTFFNTPKKEEPVKVHEKNVRNYLLQLAKKNGLDEKNLTINKNNYGYSLVGYCKTSAIKASVVKVFKGLKSIHCYNIRVFCQEDFLTQAREVLARYPTVYAEETDPVDTILLKGYLYNIDLLQTIKNSLLEEVVGLGGVQTSLLSADDVFENLSALLVKENLNSFLKIRMNTRGAIIYGSLQENFATNWNNTLKSIKNNFKDICYIDSRVNIVSPQTAKKSFFHSPIDAVSIGKESDSWVLLKNGDRYFEGTVLPSGYTIEKINADSIILNKNSETVNFNLNEL